MWAFLRRRPLDADLDAELAAHLEMAIEDNMARGLPPAEARRLALVSIGGVEQARYRHREARGFMDIDILSQDLKFTFRTLWRDPSFTAVAILILALAIGANIAVFSVVNTLLLRPLPFPNAQQLVWIAPPPTKCGLSCATYSTDAYDEFRTMSSSYQDVTGYFAFSSADNLSLNLGGAPIPATSIDVIQNFFKVLGVQAQMGRTFHAGRRAQWRCAGRDSDECVVEAAIQRRPEHCGQGIRHEWAADDGDRGAAGKFRFWRGVCAGHEGRRDHAAESLRTSARLGQHHYLHRQDEARGLAWHRLATKRHASRRTCAGTISTRRLAAITRVP